MLEGELIDVRMTVRLPRAASAHEVEAWLKFQLGVNGSLSISNPLIDEDVEAWGGFGDFDWAPTGQIGTREEFNHQDLGGGTRQCSVRYRRTSINASASADRPSSAVNYDAGDV